MNSRAIVGDVGGTNVRFGVAELTDTEITIHDFAKTPGDIYENFYHALAAYLKDTGVKTNGLSACFALAGPATNGRVELTNRDWEVCSKAIGSQFGLSDVQLINDFTAMARAVPEMRASQLESIRIGSPRDGAPIIVAGPGTGFGVATIMTCSQNGWRVLSGEGGHMVYSPITDIEISLAQLLRGTGQFVSNELICAGIGLDAVHRALCKILNHIYTPSSPLEIIELAANGDAFFLELCKIRARATMGAVGDLVLANGALGGAILAGGVSENLVTYFKSRDSIDRFLGTGPRASFLSNTPIHLLSDPAAPLIGAAAWIFRLQ